MTSAASVSITKVPVEASAMAQAARDILTSIVLRPDSFHVVMCDPTTDDHTAHFPTVGTVLTSQDHEDLRVWCADIRWSRWDFTISRGCDGVAELASMGPEGNHLWGMWRSAEGGRLVIDCFERSTGWLNPLHVDSIAEARFLVECDDQIYGLLYDEDELDALLDERASCIGTGQ